VTTNETFDLPAKISVEWLNQVQSAITQNQRCSVRYFEKNRIHSWKVVMLAEVFQLLVELGYPVLVGLCRCLACPLRQLVQSKRKGKCVSLSLSRPFLPRISRQPTRFLCTSSNRSSAGVFPELAETVEGPGRLLAARSVPLNDASALASRVASSSFSSDWLLILGGGVSRGRPALATAFDADDFDFLISEIEPTPQPQI
jgi:hypothetical protein